MMKSLILSILLALSVTTSLEASTPIDFYTFKYIVKKDEKFHEILSMFLRPDLPVRAWTLMVQETTARNPHIENWNDLETNEIIILFFDPDHLAWNELSKEVLTNLHRFPPREPKPIDDSTYWGTFVGMSIGTFDETTSDILSKSSTSQNSPITFGINFFKKKNKKDNINGSAYFSLINSVNDDNGNSFSIPSEIGVTAYYETTVLDTIKPYFGIDYENFSVFSAQEFQTSGNAVVKTVSLGFLTIGLTKTFTILKRSFFTKWSFSKSVYTSTSDTSNSYNGEKLIAFVATPLMKNLSLTGFYKKHFLRGDSILSISRFGIGLGYSFR